MADEDVRRQLDQIVAILKLAHAEQLNAARARVRSEPGKAAILDASEEWVQAGALVRSVARKVKKSDRSVRNYMSELLQMGLLEKRGGGGTTQYRSTGVL